MVLFEIRDKPRHFCQTCWNFSVICAAVGNFMVATTTMVLHVFLCYTITCSPPRTVLSKRSFFLGAGPTRQPNNNVRCTFWGPKKSNIYGFHWLGPPHVYPIFPLANGKIWHVTHKPKWKRSKNINHFKTFVLFVKQSHGSHEKVTHKDFHFRSVCKSLLS